MGLYSQYYSYEEGVYIFCTRGTGVYIASTIGMKRSVCVDSSLTTRTGVCIGSLIHMKRGVSIDSTIRPITGVKKPSAIGMKVTVKKTDLIIDNSFS
jgi:hypothetical protein